jgi:hypothetical protein
MAGSVADGRPKMASLAAISGRPFAICYFSVVFFLKGYHEILP